MTPEKHNKLLALAHLGHAGLILAFMVLMMVWMWVVLSLDPNPPPAGMFVVMGIFMSFFVGLYTIPSLIAGYALLKRKSWAKVASIVAGVICSMSAPIGTAVCAYTFWFLFSDPGKSLYDKPQQALPPLPPNWQMKSIQQPEQSYTPSSNPPDWR